MIEGRCLIYQLLRFAPQLCKPYLLSDLVYQLLRFALQLCKPYLFSCLVYQLLCSATLQAIFAFRFYLPVALLRSTTLQAIFTFRSCLPLLRFTLQLYKLCLLSGLVYQLLPSLCKLKKYIFDRFSIFYIFLLYDQG